MCCESTRVQWPRQGHRVVITEAMIEQNDIEGIVRRVGEVSSTGMHLFGSPDSDEIMGRLLDGKWTSQDLGADTNGQYVRRAAQFLCSPLLAEPP